MARKTEDKNQNTEEKKQDFIKQLRTAYRNLEDPKKFRRTVLFPSILVGVLLISLPFILDLVIPVSLGMNPVTFLVLGIVPILLGIFYPYISWKNNENDINSKMHFFITHLRVLAISDLSLKDIMNILGDKPVYGSLGKELKKIAVLSTQWRYPMAKTLHFIAERTPSKMFKDFLDRFSQSLDSGVDHREFIEIEQYAVIEEYKTMYESSNENIVILNEVYVSMLIAIIFVMSLGIVLPIILGGENMMTFIYMSSFMLLVSEGLLLYLLKAMVPQDEIWHQSDEKSDIELHLKKLMYRCGATCILIGIMLYLIQTMSLLPFLPDIPYEIMITLAITPLIVIGVKVFLEEEHILRKERNFLGFLPALGSISTMKGGKINESVYYLSRKDYGVLTEYIKNLYRRLRTRINDTLAWHWFGVDTGSNLIQRSSEMFREATYAAATPRKVASMIAENIRKLRDLRLKKLTIVNTSISLFAGITFGIAFAIYVSLVIGRHLNQIMIETGDPFSELEGINMGQLLFTVPPELYDNSFLLIFVVLIIHCFMLALTVKTLRGSHTYATLLYFVPFVWIVTVTSVMVQVVIAGMLGGG